MEAFGIVFTQPEALRRTGAEPWNPRTGWRLPVPATYVIAQDRKVLFAEAHADFRVRPEPEEVLSVLPR